MPREPRKDRDAQLIQSAKATEFQRKTMSRLYRGKEIFKPLNTGHIDEDAR